MLFRSTLVRDGPNVNKTIVRKLGAIKNDNPDFGGFIDLGSYVFHNVHNAFGKGLEEYGKDIEQLCVDIHSLFKYSAARRETITLYNLQWVWRCTISKSIQR